MYSDWMIGDFGVDENSAKAADWRIYPGRRGICSAFGHDEARHDSTVASVVMCEIMQSGGIASFRLLPSWS